MGCSGSSQPQAVPLTPEEYKSSVRELWDKVERTLDLTVKTKPVVERSGWKTIRIFVSSTFKDFHDEREVLVKEIFPDLREWCHKRRLHLLVCDPRWGIPKGKRAGDILSMSLGEIDRCYKDNIMPFFLNITSERCGWIPSGYEVPRNIFKEYNWVYGLSITEMEVMHGAYRGDNPNALFMLRNSSFLKTLPDKHRNDFIDPNPIAEHKLELLKEKLTERMGDRVRCYECDYANTDENGRVQFHGLQKNFAEPILEFFKMKIEEQYPLTGVSLDPTHVTREAHETFMQIRGRSVLGRDSMLEKMQNYVTGVSVANPLVVLGEPGAGKSALLARFADVIATKAAQNEIPGGGDGGWRVFHHFAGAVPRSTDLEKCLKRLLVELNAVNETSMPTNLDSACHITRSSLSHSKTNPVIIIIDAIEQFDDADVATILSWLPHKLAPQVRVIISMTNESFPHDALKKRDCRADIVVTPLDMNTVKEIVKVMLKQYNRELDHGQMKNLTSKASSQNPLWLSVACEELRTYDVYEKINNKIDCLADGLTELFHQVFDRFEEENGGKLVVATLCLLEASCTGLLESELLEILADEDNLMPPAKGFFEGFFKSKSDDDEEKNNKKEKTKTGGGNMLMTDGAGGNGGGIGDFFKFNNDDGDTNRVVESDEKVSKITSDNDKKTETDEKESKPTTDASLGSNKNKTEDGGGFFNFSSGDDKKNGGEGSKFMSDGDKRNKYPERKWVDADSNFLSDGDAGISVKKSGGGVFNFLSGGDKGKSDKDAAFAACTPAAKWTVVYRALRPFLRPFGDSGEGILDFHYCALRKAVRKKYWTEKTDRLWWHNKLAEYFSKTGNIERKVEELPYHLTRLGNFAELKLTLTDWQIFDMLYDEDYSGVLLKLWREGLNNEENWQLKLKDAYEEALQKDMSSMTEDLVSTRYEQIARLCLQAGRHDDSFSATVKAMELETGQLGSRPERLVELSYLAASICDEKGKLYGFISEGESDHKNDIRFAILHARESIRIRETLPGKRHQDKLGKTLNMLAFNLSNWNEMGGDAKLSGEEAIKEGKEFVERAVAIFTDLCDDGMLAEALMTKGILADRGEEESITAYKKALELSLAANGEYNVLTSRLYLNIGIFYEDQNDYETSCDYFVKWHDVCEEIYGYHHPKTQRARDTLKEPVYKLRAAKIMKDRGS